MASPTDVVDGQVNDSFDQAYLEIQLANLKNDQMSHNSHVDLRESDAQNLLGQRGQRSADLQSQINEQYLSQAANNANLVNAMSQANATVANRISSNAVSLDGMVLGGLMTRPDEVAEAVIGTANSNAAITGPASQGTTGVAQGALQTQVPILQGAELANMVQVNHALSVELAEIVKALAVVVVKASEEGV